MLSACCGNSHFDMTASSRTHTSQLVLLFFSDQITDLLVIAQWYKYGYNVWFYVGASIIGVSWIMQWLYSTWNLNSYLQNLLKRFRGNTYISPPSWLSCSLEKTVLYPISHLQHALHKKEVEITELNCAKSIRTTQSQLFVFTNEMYLDVSTPTATPLPTNDNYQFLTITQNMKWMTCLCLMKCFFVHLCCMGGMIESYLISMACKHRVMVGTLMDLCYLHTFFQSVTMCPLQLMFVIVYYSNSFAIMISLVTMSSFVSFLSICIFCVNFEKFRYSPLYHGAQFQFTDHNVFAIYLMISGDFLLRCVPKLVVAVYLWQHWNMYLLRIVCIVCGFVMCFVSLSYHIYLFVNFQFLCRDHWTLMNKYCVSYQVLHPLVNLCDIEAVFAYILKQFLFVYGSVVLCNMSIVSYLFLRPVISECQSQSQKKFSILGLNRFLLVECLTHYVMGIVMVMLLLLPNASFSNSLFSFDIAWLVVSGVLLCVNVIIFHNIRDTPIFHVDLFRTFSNENYKLGKLDIDNLLNGSLRKSKLKLSKFQNISCLRRNAKKCAKMYLNIAFPRYRNQKDGYFHQTWATYTKDEKWDLTEYGAWQRELKWALQIKKRKRLSDASSLDRSASRSKSDDFHRERYALMEQAQQSCSFYKNYKFMDCEQRMRNKKFALSLSSRVLRNGWKYHCDLYHQITATQTVNCDDANTKLSDALEAVTEEKKDESSDAMTNKINKLNTFSQESMELLTESSIEVKYDQKCINKSKLWIPSDSSHSIADDDDCDDYKYRKIGKMQRKHNELIPSVNIHSKSHLLVKSGYQSSGRSVLSVSIPEECTLPD